MSDTEKKGIGGRIVAARRRKGLSQRQLAAILAERLNKDPESVRRSLINNETGANAPRFRTLVAIAEATEQPLDFFRSSEVDADSDPFQDAA